MSDPRRNGTPKAEVIFEYWDGDHRIPYTGPDTDEWGIMPGECFACGKRVQGLARCHIIPVICGGSNDPENLHLLCPSCHTESEGIKLYWNWFNWKRQNEWDYPHNHVLKLLKMQGIDLEKEINDFLGRNGGEYTPDMTERLWAELKTRVKLPF